MIKITVISPGSLAKQARFATAGALNDAAFAARDQLVKQTAESFTVRNTWTTRGYHVTKASRTTQEAIVGSKRQYIEDQTVGATRDRAAIPTQHLRRNPRSVIYKRRWPDSLRGGRFVYIQRGNHTGRRTSTMARYSAVYRRMKRRLRILWLIPEVQNVHPRFPFKATVWFAVQREFQRAFPKRLKQALETAK